MKPEEFARLYELEESFWWFAGMRKITAAVLDPVCPPGSDRAILDAGCGTGWNLHWLRRYTGRGGRVVGIDIDPVAVELSRTRHTDDVIRASVLDLPFPDATFDLVTSFDVLPQLAEGSDELALREMHRVLRAGGVVFVRAAAYEWLRSSHDEALSTHHRYRLGTLVERVTGAGFDVVRRTYANTVLLPLVASHRLLLKRVGLAAPGSDVRPLPRRLAWLEGMLAAILSLEAAMLGKGHVSLPFGLSAICIARKPHTQAAGE